MNANVDEFCDALDRFAETAKQVHAFNIRNWKRTYNLEFPECRYEGMKYIQRVIKRFHLRELSESEIDQKIQFFCIFAEDYLGACQELTNLLMGL